MEKNRVIFNKKLLEKNIANYSFGNLSEKIMIIKKWFEFYEKGVMDKSKETVLQGDFLTDFFGKILGYKNRLESNEEWTMDKETKTKADNTRADGAIGYFSQSKTEIKAVIELKDSRTNLDERQHRLNDRSTPVEQAFSYSFKSGKSCNWVIISNYKEIRVYNAKDSNEYEVFHISTLQNENELKKFIYLLSYETLISRQKESIVDALYRINTEAEKEITSKFYKDYRKLRENLFNQIKEKNQNIEEMIIFEKTQKLLDRFIFICFCEDTGLLGERTIRKLVARAKERLSRSDTKIWDEMKDLFIAIDMGSPAHNINRFNGGLFAEDKIIDSFIIEDIIFEELALISDYDFASDLNVNILGHIFEQSLNDLEEIKARINGEEFDEKKGKRKKDGIFYTPEYITKYIVEQAVGGWLEDRKIELGFYELPELTDDDRKAVYKNKKSDERVYTQNSLKHIEFWQKYKLVLANIKVLDPACGSGAFLNQAFDFLFSEGQRVNKAIADLKGIYSFEDLTAGILKNNIYGVDLNEESVEITKLSLWLKTANRNDPLTTLDNNIKCGNSLIDDKEIAGEKAFKWEEEFKEIMDNGGFDVVIGNPPYVRQELLKEIKPYLEKNYEVYTGTSDLFVYFFEKGLKVLKSNSYFSFIVSNKFLKAGYGKNLTQYLQKNYSLTELIDFGDVQIFEGATTYPCIVTIKKKSDENLQKFNYLKLENQQETSNFSGTVKSKSNIIEVKNDVESWIFENPAKNKLLEKLKNKGKILDEYIGGNAYRGVVTGLNEVFVIDSKIKNEIVEKEPQSEEFIKPYLRGRDIGKYFSNWNNQWLLFIPWHFPLNKNDIEGASIEAEKEFNRKYPVLYQYLLNNKSELSARNKVETGIRYEWYALQRCAASYYQEFSKPKIIYQKFQVKSGFTYDDKGTFVNDAVWFIPADSKYLLGILNSKPGWYLISNFCTEIQNGYQLIYDYMKKIPIAIPTEEQEKEISGKADKMIELNKTLLNISSKFISYISDKWKLEKVSGKIEEFYLYDFETLLKELKKQKIVLQGLEEYSLKEIFDSEKLKLEELKKEIEKTDKEIDKMVYELYGLTEEEIAIIEG